MADIVKELDKIQRENQELKTWKRDTERTLKKIADSLPKDVLQAKPIEVVRSTDFEAKISSFYGLYDEIDKQKFLDVMLNESSRNYFESRRYGSDGV